MVKVVYDTNIIISAIIAKGRPYLLLQLAYNDKVDLFISPDLLKEYEEVIKRPKFKISKADISGTLSLIKTHSKMIIPKMKIGQMPQNQADNKVLEFALSAKADYLITGNKKHFTFSEFKGTKILNPAEFIEVISKELL